MTESDAFRGSIALGLVALILLGPVVIVGIAVAALALAAAAFGIEVSWLSRETPLDFLYDVPGAAGGGELVQYATFMIAGLAAMLSGTAIAWAFKGKGWIERFLR